jgi:hypothetical protein
MNSDFCVAPACHAQLESVLSWDRCYDFLNIFAKKFSKKIGVFGSKQSQILKKIDHNIGIYEKSQFFRRK